MSTEQMVLTEQSIEAQTQTSSVSDISVLEIPERAERRGHARYPFTATLEAVELKSKTRIQGRTSDLSRGGCYVDTISPFPVSTIVKMRIVNGRRAFETHARVVYSLQGMGMGLQFCLPEGEQAPILEKWIGELAGELPVEAEESESQELEYPAGSSSDETYYVLNELIVELMRSKVLSADRCKNLLQKLNGAAKPSAA